MDRRKLPKTDEWKRKVFTPEYAQKMSNRLKGRKILWAKKISQSLTGRKLSPIHKEKAFKNLKPHPENLIFGSRAIGKKHTLESRMKRSLAQKGERGSNWQGGKTAKSRLLKDGLAWKLWRQKVFERDSYSCQKCGQIGGDLEPHHLKPKALYPKLVFNVSNGVTLCKSCHRKTDSFGVKLHQNYFGEYAYGI